VNRARLTIVLTFALLMLVALVGVPTAGAAPDKGSTTDSTVLNIGHRGASGYAPEHTFASYDLAIAMGADYIEQDLQMTKDGVLVVMHDETLDRTARPTAESEPGDCTGLVIEHTLEQIKTCEVGSWFNEAYPQYADPSYVGLEIPTLEEVFQRYGTSVNYYIETKNPEAVPCECMEEELLRLMDEYGLTKPAEKRWQVLIQSFSADSLQEIHGYNESLPLIQLYSSDETSGSIQLDLDAVSTYAVGIGPSQSDVDAALVKAAHDLCLDVHPYTLIEARDMKALLDLGVDGMFTNNPDRLEELLGKSAAHGKRGAMLAAEDYATCRAAA
jgi:glycerophosphoryl diester phosphodiesterase